MSSSVTVNHRQPVDFIKQDHLELVEELRRKELELLYIRELSIQHIRYIEEHGDDFYSTQMNSYVSTREDLLSINGELLDLYYLLQYYYNYPEDYCDKLIRFACNNIIENIPINYNLYHDGFWGKDPTIEYQKKE